MATTTPNFGWAVPTSTDLVKDGAVAIETLGDAIDASLLDLKGGTTNQVLAKNSNTDMDFKWVSDATGMTNPMTTTGDTIYSSSGSTPARLGIGSTGQVLTVASGVPSWATPSSGSTFSGVYCRNSANQSIANNTYTAITLDTEIYDVGGYHSNVTNNTRFTIPSGKAGYYQIAFGAYYALNATGARNVVLYKNGSSIISGTIPGNSSVYSTLNFSYFDYLNVGDYLEFYTVQSSGGSLNIDVTTGGGTGFAQMFLIGA